MEKEVLIRLAEQNQKLGPSAARDRHLAALNDGAAAVVTGQQAGLFLGPLFTIYKAASAIANARAVSSETGRPVVPIFWLQNEDHDLPEIARAFVPSATGGAREIVLPADPASRVSVSHRFLPAEVRGAIDVLRAELGSLPHAAEHLARIERHYRAGAGWSAAFGGMLAEIFSREGLLFFDPDDEVMARHAAPIHRRALIDAEQIAGALIERSTALPKTQVHVRPGAPLSFFHPQGAGGPRFRLAPIEGGAFELVGGEGRFAKADLLAALERDPRSFSSSALLRPLVQDSLLPSVAYVGGPAEVAYFAQIEPLYAFFGRSMPRVVPRAKLRIVEEKTRRILSRLGLELPDASLPEANILARVRGAAELEPSELRAALISRLDETLQSLRDRIADPTLSSAFDKTRGTIEMAAGKLAEKYEKALENKDQIRVEDVRRLKSFLEPNGAPQERVYGMAYFASRYGEAELIDRILKTIVPFDGAQKDLEL